MSPKRPLTRARRTLILVAIVLGLILATEAVPRAHAGSYTVAGTCGQWAPWGDTTGSSRSTRPARTCGRATSAAASPPPAAPAAAGALIRPPGTGVAQVELQGSLQGFYGWQAAAYTEGLSARELVNCPGVTCPGAAAIVRRHLPDLRQRRGRPARALRRQPRCSNSAARRPDLPAQRHRHAQRLQPSPPARSPAARCSPAAGRAALQTLVVDGSDNIGIQSARALIDGSACRQRDAAVHASGRRSRARTARRRSRSRPRGSPTARTRCRGEVVDATGQRRLAPAARRSTSTTPPPTQPLDVAVVGRRGLARAQRVRGHVAQPAAERRADRRRALHAVPDVPDRRRRADARPRASRVASPDARSGANLTRDRRPQAPGPGPVGPEAVARRRGRQRAARQRRRDRRPRLRRHAARAASPSPAPDPQDPARVHVQAADAVSGRRRRRDRGPPRRPGRLAAAADRGHRGRAERVRSTTRRCPRACTSCAPASPTRPGLEASNDRVADGQPAHDQAPDPARQPPHAPAAAATARCTRPRHAPQLPLPARDQADACASAARRACTGG